MYNAGQASYFLQMQYDSQMVTKQNYEEVLQCKKKIAVFTINGTLEEDFCQYLAGNFFDSLITKKQEIQT